VRGAPAIAIVGCLSLAVELLKTDFSQTQEAVDFVTEKLEYLVSSRPTAVNMKEAAVRYSQMAKKIGLEKNSVEELKKT